MSERNQASSYDAQQSRDKFDPTIFTQDQLRKSGLVVQGDYPGVHLVFSGGLAIPVESRLGTRPDGELETTFYPIDLEMGKAVVLTNSE